jgi:hypothetical protein
VVGTFSASPSRADWFFIGLGTTVVVPAGGAHLYVAQADTNYTNDTGEYTGNLTVVPEPASLSLLGIGMVGLLRYARSRKQSVFKAKP